MRSARPLGIARSLQGLTATDALARVGLLFPLCGAAHRAALGAAIAAATSRRLPAPPAAEVLIEQVEAHGWRFGIDLPPALGLAPDPRSVGKLRQVAGEVRRGQAPARALLPLLAGIIEGQGLAGRLIALARELDSRGFGFTIWPALGQRSANWFDERLERDTEFGDRPAAEDGPAEVGPGAGLPLAARIRAQMDLALALPDRIALAMGGIEGPVVRWAGGPGAATGVAETARGPLAYRVAMEGERIASIASVAPTEWNFHPEGPASSV